ncbi:MAG: lipid II flippase MurJ [Anaerolineae bacterium]
MMVAQRDSLGRRIFRDTANVTTVNLVAQALAYVLAAYVAATFGANSQTDAINLALIIPTFAANVVREAIKSVMVPELVDTRVNQPDRLAALATRGVLAVAGLTLALTLILALALPAIMGFLTRYSAPDVQALSLSLSYVLLPMLPLVAVTGALAAVFNAHARFRLPAALPGIDAVAKIVTVAALVASIGIFSLAVGFVLGPLVSVIILVGVGIAFGFLGRMRGNPTEGLKHIGKQALLPLIGLSLLQLNPFIDRTMASWLAPGSVTALNYAERITAIPYIIVGAGFFGVLLAHWSDLAAREGSDGLRRALRNATAMIIYTLSPIVVLMAVLRVPIVTVLLQRGAFDAEATALTASALGFLVIGVLPNYLSLLVSRAFLSAKDIVTPTWLGVVNAVLNLSLNFLLIGRFGLAGIALSTAVTWTIVSILGYVVLRRRLGPLDVRSLLGPTGIIALAAVLAALAAYLVRTAIPASGTFMLLVQLTLAGGAGLVVYVAVTMIARVEEAAKLKFLLLRGRA